MKKDPLPKRTVPEKAASFPIAGQLRWVIHVFDDHDVLVLPLVVVQVHERECLCYGLSSKGTWEFSRVSSHFIYRKTTDSPPDSALERHRGDLCWYFTKAREHVVKYLIRMHEGGF